MIVPTGTRAQWDDARAIFSELGALSGLLGLQVDSRHLVPALESLALVRAKMDELTDELVLLARESDESWLIIGTALGMSRQAAWERFSKRLEA